MASAMSPAECGREAAAKAKAAGKSAADQAIAAGAAAATAAEAKGAEKAAKLKLVADAATSACVEAGAPGPEAAEAVAAAVKAAGGAQADVVNAAANAVICALPKQSREAMTDSIFKAWDKDSSGTLEFEEVLPHYMQASNHTDEAESKVRAGFERFIKNQGKKKDDPMDRALFGKWLGRATMQQVTYQYLQGLQPHEAEAAGVSREHIARSVAHAVKSAGGDSSHATKHVFSVAKTLGFSRADAAIAGADAAKHAGASHEEAAKIALNAVEEHAKERGLSAEDAKNEASHATSAIADNHLRMNAVPSGPQIGGITASDEPPQKIAKIHDAKASGPAPAEVQTLKLELNSAPAEAVPEAKEMVATPMEAKPAAVAEVQTLKLEVSAAAAPAAAAAEAKELVATTVEVKPVAKAVTATPEPARVALLPPWWCINNVKPDGPEKDKGTWKAVTFSEKQQAQFGVDEDGNIKDQAKFDKALKEHKTKAEEKQKKLKEEEAKGKKLEEKYEKLFDKVDSGKKGVLSNLDLQRYFANLDAKARKELGLEKWQDFLKEADLDGDGKVDRDEFVAYFTYANMDKEAAYNALFDAIDLDGDGNLDMDEVRDYPWHENPDMVQMLGIPNWHAMVAKMDTDGDGLISREEFVTYLAGRLEAATETAGSKAQAATAPPKPNWKQAKQQVAKRKAGGDDFNKCWDFAAGYCYRGARCHYNHDQQSQISQSELDAHFQLCVQTAKASGVNLNDQALHELQTLTETDAVAIIKSLARGGSHEGEWDKNNYVIHAARRARMQVGTKEHPDWEWYHGANKRQRKY
eukprot:TRINITY_DN12215_c0_g1_i1.p1 TRINITY_DN12215_c0_g1~~TRINITY_DN12215_c0_g1_i1.p1  ORF type:complete len:824 (-),score=284.75 TRINITY_DN12215_c0_g1_i1:125-2551(-)